MYIHWFKHLVISWYNYFLDAVGIVSGIMTSIKFYNTWVNCKFVFKENLVSFPDAVINADKSQLQGGSLSDSHSQSIMEGKSQRPSLRELAVLHPKSKAESSELMRAR